MLPCLPPHVLPRITSFLAPCIPVDATLGMREHEELWEAYFDDIVHVIALSRTSHASHDLHLVGPVGDVFYQHCEGLIANRNGNWWSDTESGTSSGPDL